MSADFRSDTVTRPTPEMRAAMAAAEVGDDVLDGDPTCRELEEFAAEWLGKDGALFVPSGTMANQIAIGSWVRPGQEVIVGDNAHVVLYEAGALAALHGAQAATLPTDGGRLDPEAVARTIRAPYIHCPETALVCVEQTHMGAGGRVVPEDNLIELRKVCAPHGVPMHMDGARLANAVAASGIPAQRWTSHVDSVSLCLSKGLGAPIGSIVAGSEAFLGRARVLRKRLGGWMRQVGLIAAAAKLALESWPRLVEDHALAQSLARSLDRLPGLSSPPEEVETNIVMVRVDLPNQDAPGLSRELESQGVRVLALSPDVLRFVTHRDVTPADVERVVSAFEALLSQAS